MRRMRGLVLAAACAWVVEVMPGAAPAVGGERATPPIEAIHLEQPDVEGDQYLPPFPGPKSAAMLGERLPLRGGVRITQVNVNSLGNNIPNDAGNEPSIAIDPNDPDKMVIGWRQFDTVLSSFRKAGWAYSHDAGNSWTFPGSLSEFVFRSDPVLTVDSAGTFYYCSLRGDFTVHFFKSLDGGVSWQVPVEAFGGDKQWTVIDRTGGIGEGNIYLSWQTGASCCGSRIFTRSTDGGLSFMEPINIPGSAMFGTMAVGLGGELYIAGISGSPLSFDSFRLARSSNAQDPNQTPEFEVATLVEMGGALGLGGGPNPIGLLGQVWVACDHTDGLTAGNVYILCSVDPPGADPLDVMLVRSTDGGQTWSEPIRVNDDSPSATAWQWFGTMSVAPNGRIDVFWNDTRNDTAVVFSELYYTSSFDGGSTWSTNRPVSRPFNHFLGYPQNPKLGDYYHSVSGATGADLAFAATFNGEQDVYHLRLDHARGDGDGDGDSDLEDFARFNGCAQGPGVMVGLECRVFDVDGDGDVDFGDFGGIQRDYTGGCATAIVTQPISGGSCDGGAFVLEVEAVGEGLSYQWHHNWLNIPGATDMTLIVDPVTEETSGIYGVEVQSDCGLQLSEAAMVEVSPAPLILEQPVDVKACFGDQVSFSIDAIGFVEPLSYQWQFNGTNIPGATDSTVDVGPVVEEDVGLYRCVLRNGCDSVAISDPAALDVPVVAFTTHPTGGTLCVGSTLFVLASATGLPTYQWFKDGEPLEGATLLFLSIQDLSLEDSGVYSVVATGLCNTVESNEAVVEVIECGGVLETRN
ncbi:MAG: hypothetical protein V3W34_02945 [Phycisphaerae bacterium]